MEEWIYGSIFSCPRHKLEVSGPLHAPAVLTLGERVPSIQWIGSWVDSRVGMDDVEKRKFLTLLGLEHRPFVIQPLASRHTDCATPSLATPNVEVN
jgi:hypothetical protein